LPMLLNMKKIKCSQEKPEIAMGPEYINYWNLSKTQLTSKKDQRQQDFAWVQAIFDVLVNVASQ
jgi:hypothetical protein